MLQLQCFRKLVKQAYLTWVNLEAKGQELTTLGMNLQSSAHNAGQNFQSLMLDFAHSAVLPGRRR